MIDYTTELVARLSKLVIPDADADKRREAIEWSDSEAHRNSLWNRAGVPKRHAALAPGQANHQWSATRSRLVGMMGRGVTVVLTGTRGSGKTQLAVECIRHVTRFGKPALFTTAESLFTAIRASFSDSSKRNESEVLGHWRAPALLVIDEIGQSKGSDFEARKLFDLLNWRYNDMSDTVLTANLEVSAIRDVLGASLVDRMREGGGIMDCRWPSFRA